MKKLIFVLVFLLTVFTLSAENFYIENYSVNIDVQENRVYNVTEDLLMDFIEIFQLTMKMALEPFFRISV